MSKLYYNNFDDYVKDYPEGERFRFWLTGVHSLTDPRPPRPNRKKKKVIPQKVSLVLGTGPHSSLPGGYLWAKVIVYQTNPKTFGVYINDCDDGSIVKEFITEDEAEQGLEELKLLTPFTMWDLESFGYKWE